VAELAFGEDADDLGGLVAGGSSWVQFTDTQHCGKMVVLLTLMANWHAAGDKGAVPACAGVVGGWVGGWVGGSFGPLPCRHCCAVLQLPCLCSTLAQPPAVAQAPCPNRHQPSSLQC